MMARRVIWFLLWTLLVQLSFIHGRYRGYEAWVREREELVSYCADYEKALREFRPSIPAAPKERKI